MEKVEDKFLRYIKINTQSDYNSKTTPSTINQFDLANKLKKELEDMGLKGINISDKCYLTAYLPANTKKKIPTIGFISHIDTSPDYTGANVKPKIFENYKGSDLILNQKKDIILSPEDFPELNKYIGETIITTDGNTLLGADNKAGIAEIMSMLEYLIENPDIEHGTVKVAFTPDEEIGKGADNFNVEKFKADFAFTVDGGELGELEYENFNAALLNVKFSGRNVHPGTAKNKMINSIMIAHEFISMLPQNERPEFTDGYEGFFHITDFKGTIENTELSFIIRDHDKEKFENKKTTIINIVNSLNNNYGADRITSDMKDQYYNMKEKIEPVMFIVDTAKIAMEKSGVIPKIKPIRGGTDGSKLSYMGLPCPNIFTGGHNFHGKFEFIPVGSMHKAVEVLVNIVKEFADK